MWKIEEREIFSYILNSIQSVFMKKNKNKITLILLKSK